MYNIKHQSISSPRLACQVSVPSRTSVSVLDMNTFEPGVVGGGNLGFTIDRRTEVAVNVAPKFSFEVLDELSETRYQESFVLAQHTLQVWRKVFRSDCEYGIFIEKLTPAHIGLASSAALQVAIISALNWIHGLPFSEEMIRQIVASNYREAVGVELLPAFSTGLSSFLNLYGGFGIVGPSSTMLLHLRVPAWNYAIAIPQNSESLSFGVVEHQMTMNAGRRFDQEQAGQKSKIIWEELVPALQLPELSVVGDAIRRIQDLGSKRAEISLHGDHLYDDMNRLRSEGVLCVFLSASGPGIVLISDRDVSFMAECAYRQNLKVLSSGSLDNKGIVVLTS